MLHDQEDTIKIIDKQTITIKNQQLILLDNFQNMNSNLFESKSKSKKLHRYKTF